MRSLNTRAMKAITKCKTRSVALAPRRRKRNEINANRCAYFHRFASNHRRGLGTPRVCRGIRYQPAGKVAGQGPEDGVDQPSCMDPCGGPVCRWEGRDLD